MIKNKKIFIAVDTSSVQTASKIISHTRNIKFKIGYKFGLEFINSKKGRSFITKVKNKIVFMDLKLNDIPKTMTNTIKALSDLKINYLTVHISSGLEALKAVKKSSKNIKIVGVTTLTSLDNKDLKMIGHTKSIKNLVIQQARLADKAKLDAIVCSAQEISVVKKVFKKEIITPGMRLNKKSNDQKRVSTPNEAFKNGCDWIVIGRPITKGNVKQNIQYLVNHLSK
jgi:orotidine-5'-phosphate decarboxylase